ncbi:unnamed protein product, partial [Staurois parvus]
TLISLHTDPTFTLSGLPVPCIYYIWSPWTLHLLYLVSPRPCIHSIRSPPPTLHLLYLVSPRPCIHSIRSPRTLHSLYPVSPDPAFTISGFPAPCIHDIWSPRTLHSLYPVSPDPAFTISGFPAPCIHDIWSPTVHTTWKYNYITKYKLLNTFSHQQYIAVLLDLY